MGETDSATLSRSIEGEHGETILIEETSGSAFAEAQRKPADPRDVDLPARRSPNLLLWLGAGLVAGLAAQRAWSRLRASPPRRRYAVAFAPGQTDPENLTQTRDAGPRAMRDPALERGWDAVDEASDQSFPASDPPGFGSSESR